MNNYRKHSICILIGVVCLLILTVTFMLSLLSRITAKMDMSSNETMLNATRTIRSSINNEFNNDMQQLTSTANLLTLSGELADPAEMLANYTTATDFYHFTYLDLRGTGVDNTGAPADAAALPFLETALSQGESSYSDVYVGSSGRPQITFQSPVLVEGEQVGALYADKTLSRYNDPALFTFSGGAGCAYIVDGGTGSWVVEGTGTDCDDIYQFLAHSGNGAAIQDALAQVMRAGEAGTIGVTFRGESSLLCFMPIENSYHWYLLSNMPKHILQQASSGIVNLVMVTLAVLVLAFLLITVLLLSRVKMRSREQGRIYQERLFQNISSNVDFAFLLYSPANRQVEMVSNNVRPLFHLDPAAVLAKPGLLFDRCGMPADDPVRMAFFSGGLQERIEKEYSAVTEAGLSHWTEVHLLPADSEQYLAVLHDTTGEHHMRADLADALRQAQESNRARTAFFSSMSHDIRTPMNGIIGMTAIARANLDNPEKVKDSLDKISIASDHLLALINEVLDMSRIESGKLSLKSEPVNLPGLIANVLTLIKPELTKRGHTLRVLSSVLDYDTVMGDALHMQKILMNILSNAVKYTPDGGEISIQLQERRRNDGRIDILLHVKDNGVGMTPEFLSQLFQPFARAEDNRLSKTTGTGLGMAITKNIVDMMGGTIEVESAPGAGTEFTVSLTLPVSETGHENMEALKGQTVLIADDDSATCEGMQTMLMSAGLHADCAASGPAAVELARTARLAARSYFAVILAWKMPDLDGIETARLIRAELGREVPILLLSAYNWDEVQEKALDAGINGFLTKPVFRAELLQQLRFYTAGSKTGTSNAPALQYCFRGVRILVAEDNALNQEIVVELLRDSGAEVETVENGREAVRQFEAHAAGYYNLILMDIHMPVMDGYTATQRIRSLPRPDAVSLPIIAMTADAFAEDVRKCRNAGMDAHLSKPISIERLFALIEQYCQKESEAREQ